MKTTIGLLIFLGSMTGGTAGAQDAPLHVKGQRQGEASAAAAGAGAEVPEPIRGARNLDSILNTLLAPARDTESLSAAESMKKFRPRQGVVVDLLASEPVVRQPLNINFDARGRMWVTQYIQYPFPKGLKVVEYDRYIRAKFDKVPPPPPNHDRGADKVTIHEDGDGDGTFETVKTFIEGTNITTSALPGRDGVWVMNPPYLLFYPDKDQDDVPDGDPVVHLSGFGLEDTHSVANSLAWGPDGWIYGCNGSTTTGKVRVEGSGVGVQGSERSAKTTDFLGQCVWRYHPTKHVFEVFAEGGGNTFGVVFDDAGRLYSGTNWGNFRGLHYVQGGYYVKGWGKHGPLTNPHAHGFFEHMPHSGNADRLTHTFSIYEADLFPELRGKILGPNSLMSRLTVSRFEQTGSTFRTVEEPPLMSSDDGWFRPVDLKIGPDGALYVADFYERRISHVDPRDTWDRSTGRLYRIRPADFKPRRRADLAVASADELLTLLSHPNRTVRDAARRVGSAKNKPRWAAFALRELLFDNTGQAALEALWAIHAVDALDEATALRSLDHANPHVRRWTIRLLADDRKALPSALADKLIALARNETDAEVRSQLASSARRLPGEQAIAIVEQMLKRPADAGDAHIPLLLWWALEDKAVSHRELVVSAFSQAELWQSGLARAAVAQRLARRYAGEPTPDNQQALVRLIGAAPDDAGRKSLLTGIAEAFAGRHIAELSPELSGLLVAHGDVEIALRAGDERAHAEALRIVRDEKSARDRRLRLIEILSQVARPEDGPVLVALVEASPSLPVRRAALAAVARFDDPALARNLVALYSKVDATLRPAVLSALTSRGNWVPVLLHSIRSAAIPASDLSVDHLDRIRQQEDSQTLALAESVLGKPQQPSSEAKGREIERLGAAVNAAPGDAAAGKALYTARCAQCHALFGEGGKLGPDLTGYDRTNLSFLLLNIVDPSAAIREEYTNFRIKTKKDESFYGLVSERASHHITLTDTALQTTTIPKDQIKDERALPNSIMPEDLLADTSDKEIRDFFAYLMSPARPRGATTIRP